MTIIFEKTPLRCALMKLCVMHTLKTDTFFRKVSITNRYDGFRSSADGFNYGAFSDYFPSGYGGSLLIPIGCSQNTIFFQNLKTMHSRIKNQTREF